MPTELIVPVLRVTGENGCVGDRDGEVADARRHRREDEWREVLRTDGLQQHDA